jgi:hypothetical protein
MDRSVAADEDGGADQSGFGSPPVAAGDGFAVGDPAQLEAVATEEGVQGVAVDVAAFDDSPGRRL